MKTQNPSRFRSVSSQPEVSVDRISHLHPPLRRK
ncbi:hypothetical protein BVRB_1g007530 [Beta vulgaris subsp. vulgaris]|nr:hypothetical protein BVRB_1g007530 [Beta vulgaris subsp. vulgaris]